MRTRKIIGRDLPGGAYIEIEAEFRTGGDLSPGFAISGSIWERRGTWSGRARKRNGRDIDAGGQVTEEILAVAPELAPIVKAHLSDPSGVPMHAVANGWYFYSGKAAAYERKMIAEGKDYGYGRMLETSDRERAARSLNIPAADLPEGLDEAGFKEFADSLAGVWAQQAADARQALDAMEDGDGVEDALGE